VHNITAVCEVVNGANSIKVVTFMVFTRVSLKIEVFLDATSYVSLKFTDALCDHTASLEATERGTAFIVHVTILASIKCPSL
jgi:hypothetical protein